MTSLKNQIPQGLQGRILLALACGRISHAQAQAMLAYVSGK